MIFIYNTHIHSHTLGLGSNAILVLNILHRKKHDITIYHGFYRSQFIDCSIRVFQSFSVIGFFSSVAIINLLALKEFRDAVKPQ